MKMGKFFVVTALFFLSVSGFAARIEGVEPDYAGRTLEFFTWSDPISQTEKKLFAATIDAQGRFSAETGVTETVYAYCDIDIYRLKLLLTPQQPLKIKLPPLRKKSFADSKNPYFEPLEVWLKTEDVPQDELTALISKFDQRYFQLTEKYFNQLYYQQSRRHLDSVKVTLDQEFSRFKTPWFLAHRQLQLTALEADLSRTGREKLIGQAAPVDPRLWNQPAFADLLQRLFSHTLSTESKSLGGQKIRMMVNSKNLDELRKWTAGFTGTTSPLTEMVLLKLLHDAFYSGDFSKEAVMQMVQAPLFVAHPTPQVQTAARQVAAKLAYLYPGTVAPIICLPGADKKLICSSENQRSYLYLLFADVEIPVCQEQLKYLNTMVEKTGNNLSVFIVLRNTGAASIESFLQKNPLPGTVVTDLDQVSIGKLYRVRSYPSAFLLDQSHRVILAPARTPLDGFEHQFAGYNKTR